MNPAANPSRLLASLIAATALALSACGGGDDPGEPPLTGADIGGDFPLTDKNGETVQWSDFQGQYRIVYFGFTYCPDICPTDMQRTMQGLRSFSEAEPERAAKVASMFISIDPTRDTPEIVGEFASAFSEDLIGLTGTPEQIADAARKFAVYYKRGEDSEEGGYLMDHSRIVYLFGPDGEPLATLPADEGAGRGDAGIGEMGEVAAPSPDLRDRFWERPLAELTRAEWEALCDGCGKCCLHKIEDADTGEIEDTNVACKLLDCSTAQCSDYRNRRAFVPDCMRLTLKIVEDVPWLPSTCAYRLRAEGRPLPGWHYLISGDREDVTRAGVSVAGRVISELQAGPLEHHIVEWGAPDAGWDTEEQASEEQDDT